MITMQWNRAQGHARYVMPANVGDFYATGADSHFDVARLMTDAGLADGPATVVDERGMPCWSYRSIHGVARQHRPTEAQVIGEAEYRSWLPRRKR